VIQLAFVQENILTSNYWKTKVASWTTIGTPFYKYKGNLKLKERQIQMIAMPIASIITMLIVFYSLIRYQSIQIVFWAITVLTFVLIFRFVHSFLKSKSLQFRLNRVNKYFSKKWFGVYSIHDEPIIGLKSALNFKFPKTKRSYPSFDSDYDVVNYLGICLKTLFFNSVTRHFLFPFLSNKLRDLSLGNDKLFYKVKDVTFKPAPDAPEQQLPKVIEESILSEVIDDNKNKISIIRRLINSNTENIFFKISNLPEEKKPKLVHSMYFMKDDIILAIARHMQVMNHKYTPIKK